MRVVTTSPSTTPDWSTGQWRNEALAWVRDALARRGRRVTGPVEPRVRPWSLVWQVPTDGGPAWFKANNCGTRYEAGLLAALARVALERCSTRPRWTSSGAGPCSPPTVRPCATCSPESRT